MKYQLSVTITSHDVFTHSDAFKLYKDFCQKLKTLPVNVELWTGENDKILNTYSGPSNKAQ